MQRIDQLERERAKEHAWLEVLVKDHKDCVRALLEQLVEREQVHAVRC